ncbi:MAG: hypothetical protein PF690_10225 [Deltaproteobacteria bacterium]|jgi:hypothetical protein|nr:hypothetical protein [Deltaproteobacteria bacterium]
MYSTPITRLSRYGLNACLSSTVKLKKNDMRLSKKKAKLLESEIESWIEEKIVNQDQGKMLLESYEVVGFDWKRLALRARIFAGEYRNRWKTITYITANIWKIFHILKLLCIKRRES